MSIEKRRKLENQCKEIDENIKKGNIESVYEYVRSHFGNFINKTNRIENEIGKLVIDEDEIVDRWKKYREFI